LKQLFHYNPDTGLFSRIILPRNGCKKVGSTSKDGYVTLVINKQRYLAHRLAFFYMTGDWPLEVDHIDGNPNNNKWKNLRECTRSQNNQNKHTSGVYLHRCGKWLAQIVSEGRHYYLGLFADRDTAVARHLEAKSRLHGEYARQV
ncbi:MAG TPA: HNH endonuclease, partial [Anaerolineales bacterium]|nr:HNH endonuclease [Anaerolineales bacterium]